MYACGCGCIFYRKRNVTLKVGKRIFLLFFLPLSLLGFVAASPLALLSLRFGGQRIFK